MAVHWSYYCRPSSLLLRKSLYFHIPICMVISRIIKITIYLPPMIPNTTTLIVASLCVCLYTNNVTIADLSIDVQLLQVNSHFTDVGDVGSWAGRWAVIRTIDTYMYRVKSQEYVLKKDIE